MSHFGISTKFEEHYLYGKNVTFSNNTNIPPSEVWFNLVAEIIEQPEKYINYMPTAYYNEELVQPDEPVSYRLKEKLLKLLKQKEKHIIEEKITTSNEKKHSWELTDEERVLAQKLFGIEKNEPASQKNEEKEDEIVD